VKTCTTCGAEWSDDLKFCPNDGATLRSAGGGADLVGSIVADRYHIEKKLGEGGMGAVYLGEHVKMGRKSAIKVMTQAMANDPEAIARFNREAANAARINHHNVCAIYDFGETEDGTIYLAMEFIEGEALSDLLRREGGLPIARAGSILQQTADALQAAHDLGIVHRDLKPDNIMLAKSKSGDDVVKVVDFGIAKAMTGEEGQNVTKTGLVVGTPEYMSPEQLSGDVLDGRSDLYSLALVLYRMLTGALPFHADTAQEMMIKRLTDEPMPLAEAKPGASFPPALQQSIDKALQRMPSERYETVAAFARDVAQAVSGTAAAAPAVDTEGATQVLDAGGATELLAATRVGDEAAPAVAEPAPPETPTPTTPQPMPSTAEGKKKAPVMAIAATAAVVVVGGGIAAVMAMGGGDEPVATQQDPSQPGDVTPGTETPPPTGDPGTLQQPPGAQQPPPAGGEQQVGGRQPEPEPPVQPEGPDLAAVDADLLRINNAILEDLATTADRARLEEIYRDPEVPATLRGRAALHIGSYFMLIVGDFEEGCRWYGLARERDPDNPDIDRALNNPVCRQ
jgi:serine/threonine-protein kinase